MIKINSFLFKKYLIEGNIEGIKKIPKADLHNHGALGGSRISISKKKGIKIKPFNKGNSIYDMKEYINNELYKFMECEKDYIFLIEESIIQSIRDGVVILHLSIDVRFGNFFDYNSSLCIDVLKNIKNKFKKNINVVFDIGISRTNFKGTVMYSYAERLILSGFFGGIDIYGDEKQVIKKEIEDLYKLAKKNRLNKKIHAFEFDDNFSEISKIQTLKIDMIQHGTYLLNSNKKLISYIKDNKIKLNICPESNISLGSFNNLKDHTIRSLFDEGFIVTLCTDDFLIFEKSLSESYQELYDKGIFNAEELDLIRRNGLMT